MNTVDRSLRSEIQCNSLKNSFNIFGIKHVILIQSLMRPRTFTTASVPQLKKVSSFKTFIANSTHSCLKRSFPLCLSNNEISIYSLGLCDNFNTWTHVHPLLNQAFVYCTFLNYISSMLRVNFNS